MRKISKNEFKTSFFFSDFYGNKEFSFSSLQKTGTINAIFLRAMLRIGINGYGRIGRNLHRLLLGREDIKVVAINSRADAKMRAHLLKYDSLHGTLPHAISGKDDMIFVNGEGIASLSVKDPQDIPWSDYDTDVVLESTGNAKTTELAKAHLRGSVRHVLVSAPMKDDTPTFVMGVNDEDFEKRIAIVSNASCTTNCIAPVLKVLLDHFTLENVFVSSIHSITDSQNLLDNSGRDLRRSRSAMENIIPTTTGSIAAIGLILPELKGKIDGLAFRVPTPTVSLCDVRLVLDRETSTAELNQILRNAANTPRLSKIIEICDEPLVSADFRTNPHSVIVDAELTKVVGGKYAQIQLWYDNEWGYAARLIDILEKMR